MGGKGNVSIYSMVLFNGKIEKDMGWDRIEWTYSNGHAFKVALPELISTHWRTHPSIARSAQLEPLRLLPPVQIPSFPIATDAALLRPGADALVVAAGAPAHDEDLLGAPEGVDGLAEEHGVHLLDDGDFVNAAEVEEEAILEVGADVAGGLEGVAVHEDVVGADEAFHGLLDDLAEYAAEVGRFLECVVLTWESSALSDRRLESVLWVVGLGKGVMGV